MDLHELFELINTEFSKRNDLLEKEGLSNKEKREINFDFVKFVFLQSFAVLKNFIKEPLNFLKKTMIKEMVIWSYIGFIMIFMFIIFVVAWLFFAILVAVYFYEQGNSMSFSVFYSLSIQFIIFIFTAASGYLVFRKSIFKTLYDFLKKKKEELTN